MNEDDKRLISWALRAYAEACDRSPMMQYCPKGESRDAKRARELADQMYPYPWHGSIYSTTSEHSALGAAECDCPACQFKEYTP